MADLAKIAKDYAATKYADLEYLISALERGETWPIVNEKAREIITRKLRGKSKRGKRPTPDEYERHARWVQSRFMIEAISPELPLANSDYHDKPSICKKIAADAGVKSSTVHKIVVTAVNRGEYSEDASAGKAIGKMLSETLEFLK